MKMKSCFEFAQGLVLLLLRDVFELLWEGYLMPSNMHLYLTAGPPQSHSFQLSNFIVQIICYENIVFFETFIFFLILGSLCEEIYALINKHFSSEIIFPITLNFSRVLVDLKKWFQILKYIGNNYAKNQDSDCENI